jgi:hypothetical protein
MVKLLIKNFKMKRVFLIIAVIFSVHSLRAQDDLMNLVNENSAPETNYTTATFKSTRVMNGHSIERMPAGQLDVRISHRFGTLNSGGYNFYGLDQSNIHLSVEYGITNWLMVGVGRGNYEKTYDGFAKFTILKQSTGAIVMPVSVSAFGAVSLNTLKFTNTSQTNYFTSRLAYVAQVLVARKISQGISLQLSPTFIHKNLVATELDPNDIYALGAGGRLKLSKRISLNCEYYYVVNPKTYLSQKIYNPLSLGFDIETGGHVFQLFFTNSIGMIEKAFIGETTGTWTKGDIRFGFNISRVFTLSSHNKRAN